MNEKKQLSNHPCYCDGEMDHDWIYKEDSAGSTDVINGTELLGWWECTRCGEEDLGREPPQDDFEDWYLP